MKIRWAAIACVALLGLGCKETVSSENIKTAGIAMFTTVTADTDTHATVRTTLLVGGDKSNTYSVLYSGDKLIAKAGGMSKEMRAVEDGIYEADFDVADKDTKFEVVFERTEFETAEDNSGRLPAPFTITTDFGSAGISRMDDDLTVEWEPSGEADPMAIKLQELGCFYKEDEDDIDDSGSFTLPSGSLESSGAGDPKTCDATLTMERTRKGSADSALDPDSRFDLVQTREAKFKSAP